MDYGFYNPYLLNKLDTIDAEELMATPYAPKNFIVADMLPEGLSLLLRSVEDRQVVVCASALSLRGTWKDVSWSQHYLLRCALLGT